VHFYDTLTVEKAATFNSSVGVSGPLGVTGPVHFYNTLTVEGDATFNSSVGVSGPLGVTGPVHFYDTLTVEKAAIFNSSVGVSGPLGVTGPTNLYNTLTVGGTAIFNGPVGISGPLGVSGTLNVGGTATFGNSIVLTGPTGNIIMNGPTGNYIQFPDKTKQYTASGAVPPGTIVMWSNNGSIGIPIYWSLCDGTSVTGQITNNGYTPPNLTDRFVYGGNISQIGNPGGESSVTLLATNMPPHSHVVSGGSGTFLTSATLPHSEQCPTDLAAPFQAWGDQNIQTQSSTFSTSLANAYGNSQGTADSFPILPPYYRLCYIMFTP
jgi:microcystin-dependent protein